MKRWLGRQGVHVSVCTGFQSATGPAGWRGEFVFRTLRGRRGRRPTQGRRRLDGGGVSRVSGGSTSLVWVAGSEVRSSPGRRFLLSLSLPLCLPCSASSGALGGPRPWRRFMAGPVLGCFPLGRRVFVGPSSVLCNCFRGLPVFPPVLGGGGHGRRSFGSGTGAGYSPSHSPWPLTSLGPRTPAMGRVTVSVYDPVWVKKGSFLPTPDPSLPGASTPRDPTFPGLYPQTRPQIPPPDHRPLVSYPTSPIVPGPLCWKTSQVPGLGPSPPRPPPTSDFTLHRPGSPETDSTPRPRPPRHLPSDTRPDVPPVPHRDLPSSYQTSRD